MFSPQPTDNPDNVVGDEENDSINAMGGNDTVDAGGGNDTVDGGSGSDSILGGAGADSLLGGTGSDILDGGNGNDTLVSGTGIGKSLRGGNGNDVLDLSEGRGALDGGDGNDTLVGGSLNDFFLAGNGDDLLQGGDGQDDLNAEAGNDTILGGNGNDPIVAGGPGDDLLTGGAGADRFIYFVADNGLDLITDAAIGDKLAFTLVLSGPVTSGDGGQIGLGQVQVATGTSQSTVFIGTDATAGADITILLNGRFFANSFVVFDDPTFGTPGLDTLLIAPPLLSITDTSLTEGDVGQQDMVFTISLPAPTFADVTVTATTSSGSASAGLDFAQTSQQVTIPAGQTSTTFAVPILGDAAVEQPETFIVTLSEAINAFIGDGSAEGTIIDNDGARLVSIAPSLIGEGNAGANNAQFIISLSSEAPQDVIVTASTSNGTAFAGSDYVAITGQVTIPAGQTSATFNVPVIGDTAAEGNETFVVTLSNPVNANLGLPSSVFGTILDDDSPAGPPVLSVVNVAIEEGNSSIRNLIFTLSLTGPSDQAITLNAESADGTAATGSDYVGINQSVAIPIGQTSAMVAVAILGDTVAEGDETLTLGLSNLVGATFAGGGATLAATGTIIDDDASLLSIGNTSVAEGNAGTTALNLPLTLSSALAGPSVVSFRTLNGFAAAPGDFTAMSSGSVTIAAGQTSGTITISVAGDAVLECDEFFTVELTSVTGGAALSPTGSRALATIVNDDLGNAPAVDGRVLSGGPLADGLFGFLVNDSIAGGGGGDTLVGDAGADILAGEAGADFLVGESGEDSLLGGEANDILVGGAGEDTMRGGNGEDALFGNAGNDTAIGGNGHDVLLGEDGNDLLCGEGGNDFLIGGAGADRLDAGTGDDRVVGDGSDVYLGGGAGVDVLAITGAGLAAVNLAIEQNQNAGAGPTVQGFEAVDASGSTAAVSLAGAEFNGAGTVLLGSTLNDTITGSNGADIVFGNAGADVMNGAAGNDSLFGGFGNDSMTGGAGQDAFFYAANANSATQIVDFVPADDTVFLPASLNLDPLQARLLLVDIAGSAVLDLGSGRSLAFIGVASASIFASDFAIA